jgi:acyl carrier protein
LADIRVSASESKVIDALKAVFANKGAEPPALTPDTPLDGTLGLESLDLAELVVRLEQAFGTDPFAEGNVPQVGNVRELAALYE